MLDLVLRAWGDGQKSGSGRSGRRKLPLPNDLKVMNIGYRYQGLLSRRASGAESNRRIPEPKIIMRPRQSVQEAE